MDSVASLPRRQARPAVVRRLIVAGLVLLLAAAGAPLASAGVETVGPKGGEFHLVGHGWGHGRGMSQWGAQGGARRGHDYRQILGFYYPGSSLDTVSRGDVRVKITKEDSDLVARAPSDLRVTDLATGVSLGGAELGEQVRVARASDGYLRIQRRVNGRWQSLSHSRWSAQRVLGPVELSRPGTLWLTVPGGAEHEYRGTLTAHRSGSSIDVVNTVDLEEYLYGVVPRESPSWFEPAALQAQAVAARSYAWADCSRGAPNYDLRDNTSCQVYEGKSRRSGGRTVAIETAQTRAAVDATRHQVLRRGGAVLRTEFSSSNGGWTVASNGWPAQQDPWDGVDQRNANHDWSASVSTAAVARAWPQVGEVRRLEVLSRTGGGDFGGRVTQLRVVGSRGSVVVSGNDARFALGLKSDWFGVADGVSGTPKAPTGPRSLDFPVGEVGVVASGSPTRLTRVASEHGRPLGYSEAATQLGAHDPDSWRFFLWGDGSDQPPDLVGVKLRNTGSGRVEVHVLSGASGYTTFTAHEASPLPALAPGDDSWQFAIASHRGSGDPDLFALRLHGGGSGRTEVHVLSADSRWRRWVRHSGTAFGPLDPRHTTLVVGDDRQGGDLMAVVHGGATGSGRTEVHRLSQASGYKRFNLHAATPLHLTEPGSFGFEYGDYDQDGRLDLYTMRVRGGQGGRVELHVLSGSGSFRSWKAHKLTTLPSSEQQRVTVRQW